jgi:hypothetical protein
VTLLVLLGCATEPLDSDRDGVIDSQDCAPTDRQTYEGALELCDGVDNDCDGAVDELYDLDGDGHLAGDVAACRVLGGDDCDDLDPARNPSAEEVCNGIDDDCNGRIDDALDADEDGFSCDDCDDADPFTHPGAPEVCDGLDNDCSGASDEGWDDDGDGFGACLDCQDDQANVFPDAPEACNQVDDDCDGAVDEDFDVDLDGVASCAGDCDDNDDTVYSGAVELCDGIDNDCDPETVEDADLDEDGVTLCEGDCDELDPTSYPGADEACDGVDNDCSGLADDDEACWSCVELGETHLVCAATTDWNTASALCSVFGGVLAAIDDSDENALLTAALSGTAWIGLNDHVTEGDFLWPGGFEPAWTNWNTGEPNDHGSGEDCVELRTNGVWNDQTCSSDRTFICEF